MYNNRKMRFVSYFLAITILICSCMSGLVGAAEITKEFTITFRNNINADISTDISGIKVDVYLPVNVIKHTENLEQYDKKYLYSAYTDKDGKVVFKNPGCDFIVDIDLSTLPGGMGVIKQSISYSQEKSSDIVYLYSVEIVEPHFTYGSLNFIFKNKDTNILANYKITGQNVKEFKGYSEKACTLCYYGTLDINGDEFKYSFNETYSDISELEYASLLYNNNLINQSEQVDRICNIISADDGKQYMTSEVSLYLNEYLQTIDPQNEQYERLQNLLLSGYVDDENTLTYYETTYYCQNSANCCESGFHRIRIYYCTSNCTYATAQTVANRVVDIFNYFNTQLHFKCPESISYTNDISGINDSFCVILSESIDLGMTLSGSTESNEVAKYIVINPTCVTTDRYKTILAHEFQHCIQYQYKMTIPEDVWWKEACANWAAGVYANYLGELSSHLWEFQSGVTSYISDPYLSLKESGNRVYSILFPLYMYQAMNGITTIKSIYEEVYSVRTLNPTYTTEQILTAIDNVGSATYIAGHYYTLRYILENFGNFNYNYKYFYNWLNGVSWDDINIRRLWRSNVRTQNLESVGFGYFRLESSPDSVSITITTTCSDPTKLTCYVVEGFDETGVAISTKIQFTGSTLNLNYTFTSLLGEDLCIFVENTSITNDAEISILVN